MIGVLAPLQHLAPITQDIKSKINILSVIIGTILKLWHKDCDNFAVAHSACEAHLVF